MATAELKVNIDDIRKQLVEEMQQIAQDAYKAGAVDALLDFSVRAGLLFGEAPQMRKVLFDSANNISPVDVKRWLQEQADAIKAAHS